MTARQRWPCFDTDLTAFVEYVVFILTSLHLHEKSIEVCIKTDSPLDSVAFNGQVTVYIGNCKMAYYPAG